MQLRQWSSSNTSVDAEGGGQASFDEYGVRFKLTVEEGVVRNTSVTAKVGEVVEQR